MAEPGLMRETRNLVMNKIIRGSKSHSRRHYGALAQLIERYPCKVDVRSLNLLCSTNPYGRIKYRMALKKTEPLSLDKLRLTGLETVLPTSGVSW